MDHYYVRGKPLGQGNYRLDYSKAYEDYYNAAKDCPKQSEEEYKKFGEWEIFQVSKDKLNKSTIIVEETKHSEEYWRKIRQDIYDEENNN